jgi:ABC-type transport system involved in multi-copper enzyme maturation permease subunit
MTWTLAAVTLRRVLRGRALWVAGMIALLPVGFAAILERSQDVSDAKNLPGDVFAFEQLVLGVLPAMFVASSIGEDIEDRTATYLWSRPVPRWSVLAGKLVALVPIICAITLASWTLAHVAGTGELPGAASNIALALDAIGLSIVAAAIAVLAARYAMALTICYMLFLDVPLGLMPAAIQNVSLTYHGRVIAEVRPRLDEELATNPYLGIAIIAGLWAIVALWRVRRLEA